MKKGLSLFVGMALALGAGTSEAQEHRIQSVFQEAHQASCADSEKAARRPMCLSEAEMMAQLLAVGGDEDLMASNLSGEGRLRVKPTRYGTVRRISGPSLSNERLGKGEDPVDFVRRYFARNAEAFGIEQPYESLLLPRVFELKYGGKVVKFKQYYGSVPVYRGQVVAYIGKDGDLLMAHASVIPDNRIRVTLGDKKEVDELTSRISCEEAESFSISGSVRTLILDPSSILLEGDIQIVQQSIGYTSHSPAERLFDPTTGETIKESSLSSSSHRYSVSDENIQSGQAINSTYWCDYATNTWPDQQTEDLWDVFQHIHDKALTDHSFDGWTSCHCYPLQNGYDFGMAATIIHSGSGGEHHSCVLQDGSKGTRSMEISDGYVCVDLVGHELTHGLQAIFSCFENTNPFSHSQQESSADIVGELFEDSPDWAMFTGTSNFPGRDMSSYIRNSYKWWDIFAYLNCPSHQNEYANMGPLETAAWLLGDTINSITQYGITVDPIGAAKTSELFWNILVSSSHDQIYEETAGLARIVAADIWGSSSFEYHEVCDAMDAVGIWREPSYVYYDDNGLQFPVSRFSPSAVDWIRSSGFFNFHEHWLAYTDHESSPSTPADICWVRGINSNWSTGGCLGLSSAYKTILPADATVFDDKIWIYFKPAYSTLIRYVTIDKSLNFSSVSSSGIYSSSYPKVTSDGDGIIVSIIAGSPYLKYYTPPTTKTISVPIQVFSGKTPTPVYNEGDDSIFVLFTGTDERAYLIKGDWSCLVNNGSNCWKTAGPVPNGSRTYYDETATGSPSGELWGGELYVSQTIDGPWIGEDTIYTDSCYSPSSSITSCNNGDFDCGPHDPLTCPEDWNQSVPRDLPSVDPGELKGYLNRLWLLSSDGLYLHQTWKNSYGLQ